MENMKNKKTILVTNDDGIRSEGLLTLARSLKDLGEVIIVAPDREQSASGHSLTLHRPLRMEKVSKNKYFVDGTPTDCVTLAVHGLLKDRKIDLVMSGINKGQNMGEDITYSGTVSAAMEGTLLGIPSVALSLIARKNFKFKEAGLFANKIAKKVLKDGLPDDTLLNVNIPGEGEIKGYKITEQGKRQFTDVVTEKKDPRGKSYYWIGGDIETWEGSRSSDYHVTHNNYISITPVHLNLTNYDAIKIMRKYRF